MIAQVLNKTFVLEQLKAVRSELEQGPPDDRRGDNDLPFDHSPEDYQAAADALRQAAALAAVTDPSPVDSVERRGMGVPGSAPLEDFAFIVEDPAISLLQSALEEYFFTQRPDLLDQQPPQDDDRRGGGQAGGDDVLVTDVSLADLPPRRDPETNRRLFGQFSETDPRWIASVLAEGIRKFRGKHAFNRSPASPVRIGNNARLIVVGDWGSGLPRARRIAGEIRKTIDHGKETRIEQHVIHLGDVYYSGWKREYDERFLRDWPVRPEEANDITSWSLNANHDMYSGGHDYFDYLLADPRFTRHEHSSVFSLTNDHWQILGLDTGYEEGALCDPQPNWVREVLGAAPGKKSMVFSHHQLFSGYEKGSPAIARALEPVLGAERPIDAWFWGHEHRCVFYGPHQNVRHARLIGHGGVPVYMLHRQDAPYPDPVTYEYRDYLVKSLGLEHFALFGFAVLDFAGSKIMARYIDEKGREHKREQIA